MKLNAKQKELLKLLVKGKGRFKTPIIPKDHSEKNLDDIVKLYLKGLLSFERKFDIDIVGPSNEHMIRYKWYIILQLFLINHFYHQYNLIPLIFL